MKRIVAESLVDKFLRYHDDESNWSSNREGFEKMYAILEQYDDSNGNDTVDVAFLKAPEAVQRRMIALITPKLRVGESGYARSFFKGLVAGEYGKGDYADGAADVFDALFKEGLLDREDFS